MKIGLATYDALPALNDDDRLLLPALSRFGFRAEPVCWGTPIAPDIEAVILRSCWDYCGRRAEFMGWIAGLERRGVAVLNGTEIVEWNSSKTYLKELASRGVRCIDTVWVDTPDALRALKQTVARRGWREIVAKPAISNNAENTYRLPASRLDQIESRLRATLARTAILVQPYLPEIEQYGELSFMIFGGAFSHAVVKRPAPGDFRVQHTHGGNYLPMAVPPNWVRLAEEIANLRRGHLYCRVDMIPTDSGLLLGELELIEPYLHFADSPESPDRFAAEVAKRLYASSVAGIRGKVAVGLPL